MISILWRPLVLRFFNAEIPLFEISKILQTVPMTFFVLGHCLFALPGLGRVNIALYTAIKRTAPLVALVAN